MANAGYGGLLGAFPYALRSSESRLFRLYCAVAALIGLFGALLVGFGVVELLAETGRAEGTGAFVRGFYVVVGLAAVAPLVAPVLLVARRHRMTVSSPGYDAALGLAGFVFLLLLYAGLVASTPVAHQEAVGPVVIALGGNVLRIEAFADLARFLYSLPRVAGLVGPALGAVAIGLTHALAR